MRVEIKLICSHHQFWDRTLPGELAWHPGGKGVLCWLSSELASFEPTEPIMEDWEGNFS